MNFTRLPELSSFAGDVDFVIATITVLVGFWFVLTEVVFFYFILKYRKKDGQKADYVDGTDPKHTRFISLPHAIILMCDVVIVVFAVKVWVNVKIDMPEVDSTVRVVAQQWAWSFVQPGADNKLDTPDDVYTAEELHVQEGLNYKFELISRDVLHSFSVPVFRLKQDCVPGRTITAWFKPTRTGRHDIQCTEICGIGHGVMGASIFIESPEEHASWVSSHAALAATEAEVTQ